MGQFKPMVKMMTTEPSVELKLKKGGKVEKKMQMGGATAPGTEVGGTGMPARGGMMPSMNPRRPSLADRKRAMRTMGSAGPTGPVGRGAQMADAAEAMRGPKPAMPTPAMKKGGKASKLNKEIRNESEEIGRVKAKLMKHEDMAASKAHKGLKTGGVVMGQGGYKTGGVVMGQGGYKKGGKVKGDSCYATGGVVMGQGGYKKGGEVKKEKATGNVIKTGAPVAMPKRPVSKPVEITKLAGTYKEGGDVKKDNKRKRVAALLEKPTFEKRGAMSDMDMDLMEEADEVEELIRSAGNGAVTETEKSITVAPGMKKGGNAMKRGGKC